MLWPALEEEEKSFLMKATSIVSTKNFVYYSLAMLAKNLSRLTHEQFFLYIDVENAVIEVIHRDNHYHEMDDRVIGHNQFLNNAKGQLSEDPKKPVKQLYDQQVALAHRSAAIHSGRNQSPPVSEFTCVCSQLSRAKSKLLPHISHDIDDIIIQGSW